MEKNRRACLTGAHLKWTALEAMVTDHIGILLSGQKWISPAFRLVGRLSFPLFCFLLVEGFLHTRDENAYGKRLLAFAFLSEIPFNLFLGRKLFFPEIQNVFFTLFLGLWMLRLIRRAKTLECQLIILLLFSAAAWLLRCDYDAGGMFLIAAFYFYRQGNSTILLPAVVAAVLSLDFYGAAALSALPVFLYGGERGRQPGKYWFYLFYPLHLLVLYGLTCLR